MGVQRRGLGAQAWWTVGMQSTDEYIKQRYGCTEARGGGAGVVNGGHATNSLTDQAALWAYRGEGVGAQAFWTVGSMAEAALAWRVLVPLGWRTLLALSALPFGDCTALCCACLPGICNTFAVPEVAQKCCCSQSHHMLNWCPLLVLSALG